MKKILRDLFGLNNPEDFVPYSKRYSSIGKNGSLRGKTILWLEDTPELVDMCHYNTSIQLNGGSVIVSNSIGYGMEKIANNEVDFTVLELILLRDPWSQKNLQTEDWYIGDMLQVYRDLRKMESAGDEERYQNLFKFAKEHIKRNSTELAGLDFIKYLRKDNVNVPCGVVSVVDKNHVLPEKLAPLELSFYFRIGEITPQKLSDMIYSSINN